MTLEQFHHKARTNAIFNSEMTNRHFYALLRLWRFWWDRKDAILWKPTVPPT